MRREFVRYDSREKVQLVAPDEKVVRSLQVNVIDQSSLPISGAVVALDFQQRPVAMKSWTKLSRLMGERK